MTEAQHSPGPWTFIDSEDEYEVGFHAEGQPLQWRVDITAPANARLIAASPTLYAYVAKRAEAGDQEASQIVEAINASR